MRSLIEASHQLQDLAPTTQDVAQPPDGIAEIHGLPTVPGHLCHFDQCHYRTINIDCIRQHYNQRHQWRVSRNGAMPWHQAHFQTLFSQRQTVHYFAVVLSDAIPHAASPYISSHANAPHNAPGRPQSSKPAPPITFSTASWEQMLKQFNHLQEVDGEPHLVGVPKHVSEITPWMRATGIYIHRAGVGLRELYASYKLP